MEILISGHTKAAKQLAMAALSGVPAIGAALYREAEAVMTAAKTDYVPVDTGALRSSGVVEAPIIGATAASVRLGFGGPAAPYAVLVHEDLTKRHTVGQAKYLEIPLKARLSGMPAVLKQRVDDAVRQAIQRLAKVEANVLVGREPMHGMPLYP